MPHQLVTFSTHVEYLRKARKLGALVNPTFLPAGQGHWRWLPGSRDAEVARTLGYSTPEAVTVARESGHLPSGDNHPVAIFWPRLANIDPLSIPHPCGTWKFLNPAEGDAMAELYGGDETWGLQDTPRPTTFAIWRIKQALRSVGGAWQRIPTIVWMPNDEEATTSCQCEASSEHCDAARLSAPGGATNVYLLAQVYGPLEELAVAHGISVSWKKWYNTHTIAVSLWLGLSVLRTSSIEQLGSFEYDSETRESADSEAVVEIKNNGLSAFMHLASSWYVPRANAVLARMILDKDSRVAQYGGVRAVLQDRQAFLQSLADPTMHEVIPTMPALGPHNAADASHSPSGMLPASPIAFSTDTGQQVLAAGTMSSVGETSDQQDPSSPLLQDNTRTSASRPGKRKLPYSTFCTEHGTRIKRVAIGTRDPLPSLPENQVRLFIRLRPDLSGPHPLFPSLASADFTSPTITWRTWFQNRDRVSFLGLHDVAEQLSPHHTFVLCFNATIAGGDCGSTGRMYVLGTDTSCSLQETTALAHWMAYTKSEWDATTAGEFYFQRPWTQHQLNNASRRILAPEQKFLPILLVTSEPRLPSSKSYRFELLLDQAEAEVVVNGSSPGPLLIMVTPEYMIFLPLPVLTQLKEEWQLELNPLIGTDCLLSWYVDATRSSEMVSESIVPLNDALAVELPKNLADIWDHVETEASQMSLQSWSILPRHESVMPASDLASQDVDATDAMSIDD